MGPLHEPGHNMNMNLCKAMMAQAKAMKSTWLTARSDGAGCVRFQGAKKRPAEGEEMNSLVDNAVRSFLTTNTFKKAKASSDSGSENKQEKFKFETPNIGGEWQTAWTLRSNDEEIPE